MAGSKAEQHSWILACTFVDLWIPVSLLIDQINIRGYLLGPNESYYPSQRMINMFVFPCLISKMSKNLKSVLKLASENETLLIIICPIKNVYMDTEWLYFNITKNIFWKSVGGKHRNETT